MDNKFVNEVNAKYPNTKYSFLGYFVIGLIVVGAVIYADNFEDFSNTLFSIFVMVGSLLLFGAIAYNDKVMYRAKMYLLDNYESDREDVISYLLDKKEKVENNKFLPFKYNKMNSLVYVDLLEALGEDIRHIEENAEEIFIELVNTTFGLRINITLWIFGTFSLIVALYTLLEFDTSLFTNTGWLFATITIYLFAIVLSIVFHNKKKEGKYILDNYQYNKNLVIEFIQKKVDKIESKRNVQTSFKNATVKPLNEMLKLLEKI